MCREWKQCAVCAQVKERNVSHTFGEWNYIEPGSCYKKRKCTRCGFEEKTSGQKHTYGDWRYMSKDSCQRIKTCSRCGNIKYELLTTHSYGEFHYINEITCEREKICSRCNESQKDIEHQWNKQIKSYMECIDYAIAKADSLIQERELLLNNMRMKSINSIEYDQNYKQKVEEISVLKMRVAEYERLKKHAHPCEGGRVCARCGEVEKKDTLCHQWSEWENVLYNEKSHIETQRRRCNVCGRKEIRAIERNEEK